MATYNDPVVPYNDPAVPYNVAAPVVDEPDVLFPEVIPLVLVVPPRAITRDAQMVVPFRIDETGGVAVTTDVATIDKMGLMTLLGTQPGERAMRLDYGVATRNLLFEADNPILAQVLAAEIHDAAVRLAPEVVVTDVRVSPMDVYGDGKAEIEVTYRTSDARLDTSSGTLRTTVSAEE